MPLKVIASKFNGANCNFRNPDFAIFTDYFKLLSRLAFKTGAELVCTCLLTCHFYRIILRERKISFVLVCNLSRFRPISMGQMAAQVEGLSLFLLLAFCARGRDCRGRSLRGSEGRILRAIHRLRLHPVSTSK